MSCYKSKLKYITFFKKSKETIIVINNGDNQVLPNYQGPDFKAGRICIVCCNSKNDIISLYLLDRDNKPFQIFGEIDVLFEGSTIFDESESIKKQIAYATQICISGFSMLTKEEIEENKSILLEFENKIFQNLNKNNLGWKSSKKESLLLLSQTDLPEYIKNIISTAIFIAPMPKSAVYKKLNINLTEYPESSFVKY